MIQAPAAAAPSAAFPPPPPPRSVLRLDQLQRAFRAALPSASVCDEPMPLELSAPTDPPRLADAELVEDAAFIVHTPASRTEAPFAAFLDGTQRSDVVGHTAEGVPVVYGAVAAVIREWRDGRPATWRLERLRRLYVPQAALRSDELAAIRALGADVADTSAGDAELADAHPAAYRDAALEQIQRDREGIEVRLAHAWCGARTDPLYVDGGLRGSEVLTRSPQPVGVVKSHRTLYGDHAARRVVFDLHAGERTSVFVLASPSHGPVASWYLRLRDRAGRDPLWGLVRVEVRHEPDARPARLTARADAVSRRILIERRPTAHPDPRWDTMVYGIRDCEALLKATP
jgi:hypothetical protein